MILPTLFVIGIFALGAWSITGLARTSADVYKKLDEFKAEAEATDDYTKLCDINTRMVEYARNYCVLRQYGAYAKEVNIYIHTKADTIRKLSIKK
jgi:hypothetical protein